MSRATDVGTLTGRHVRLEPLDVGHVDELVVAASVDRSTYGFTTVPADQGAMEAYVADLRQRPAAGEVVPFAQRCRVSERVVGRTRFMGLRHWSGGGAPDEWPDVRCRSDAWLGNEGRTC